MLGIRNDTLYDVRALPSGETKNFVHSGITSQAITAPWGVYSRLPEATFTKGTYQEIVEQLYKKNPIVYSCLTMTATLAAAIEVKLFKIEEKTGKRKEVRQGPLYKLIKEPNEFYSWAEFLTEWIIFYRLAGNAFQQLVWDMKGTSIVEMWHLRPDWIDAVIQDGRPIAYIYKVPGKIPRVFQPKEVLHTRAANPYGGIKGMSSVMAARAAADTYNAATTFNTALLQNSGNPSGIINYDGVSISQEQINDLKYQFNQDYVGPANAGKTLFTAGGKMQYQRVSFSLKDLSFLDSKKQDVETICGVLNMAPELIGREAKFKNFPEAKKSVYHLNVIPLMKQLIGAMNRGVTKHFGVQHILDIDYSSIEELQENRTDVYDRLTKAVGGGWMTINDARREAGLPEDPRPFANEYFMPGTYVQISDIAYSQPSLEE